MAVKLNRNPFAKRYTPAYPASQTDDSRRRASEDGTDEAFDYSLAEGVGTNADGAETNAEGAETNAGTNAGEVETNAGTNAGAAGKNAGAAGTNAEQSQNSAVVGGYNAVKANNGSDYAAQYLASGDKTRLATAEEMQAQKDLMYGRNGITPVGTMRGGDGRNGEAQVGTMEKVAASPVFDRSDAVVKSVGAYKPAAEAAESVEKADEKAGDADKSNADWMSEQFRQYMDNAPEYVSEEEQERRLRAKRSAQTVADLGSLASAFANLYYTGKGAPSQTVAYAKAVDDNDLVSRWQKGRDSYRTYAQKGRELILDRAKKNLDMELAKQKGEWQNALLKAQVDLANAKTTGEQVAAAAAQQKAQQALVDADRNYELKVADLNRKIAVDNANIRDKAARLGIAERNASVNEYRAYHSGSSGGRGNGGNWHVASADGLNVDVPKVNINDFNRNELLRLVGSDGYKDVKTDELDLDKSKGGKRVYKTRKVAMTKEEKWDYIVNHMNPDAEKYITEQLGGEVYKGRQGVQIDGGESDYVSSDGKHFRTREAMMAHEKETRRTSGTRRTSETGGTMRTSETRGTRGTGKANKGEKVKTSDGKEHRKFSF